MRKTTHYVDPRDMVLEPARMAVGLGLVDKHAPEVRKLVGAWRWPGVQAHRERIRELVMRGYVIDFGGAAGPIGYDSIVVDAQAERVSLYDVPGQADTIFTAHTLEHIVDLELCLDNIYRKLRRGGHLVILVPSYRKQNLHPRHHPWHHWSFCLSGDEHGSGLALDGALSEHYEIEAAEYASNDDIIIIAEKPVPEET